MPETEKLPFFQRPEFNCWLITSFFIVFAVVIFVFLPVMGAHRLGRAIGAEMSRYEIPSERAIGAPKPEPTRRPMEGIPVAYRSARNGP